jgi:hypothetical protein
MMLYSQLDPGEGMLLVCIITEFARRCQGSGDVLHAVILRLAPLRLALA